MFVLVKLTRAHFSPILSYKLLNSFHVRVCWSSIFKCFNDLNIHITSCEAILVCVHFSLYKISKLCMAANLVVVCIFACTIRNQWSRHIDDLFLLKHQMPLSKLSWYMNCCFRLCKNKLQYWMDLPSVNKNLFILLLLSLFKFGKNHCQ